MIPTPRFALITVTATLAYLGIAIVGEGGFATFFSHPALVGLTVTILVLTIVMLFSGGNLDAGEREDRQNRWIFAPLALLGLLGAYLPAYTDRHDFWVMGGEPIRWLGVILSIAGGVLRTWAIFVLGRRFSGLVAIQPEHTLATTGLYGVLRHPAYLGFMVGSLGWAVAFRSMVGILLAILTIPLILARMQAEERLLREKFGADYDAYRARTARIIPGLY